MIVLVMLLMASMAMADPLSQKHSDPGGAVLLTRPDGSPVYVNPRAIAVVRGPLTAEEGGNTTIVFQGGGTQVVIETPEEIHRIMEMERGK